jgi:hypothetical protein
LAHISAVGGVRQVDVILGKTIPAQLSARLVVEPSEILVQLLEIGLDVEHELVLNQIVLEVGAQ